MPDHPPTQPPMSEDELKAIESLSNSFKPGPGAAWALVEAIDKLVPEVRRLRKVARIDAAAYRLMSEAVEKLKAELSAVRAEQYELGQITAQCERDTLKHYGLSDYEIHGCDTFMRLCMDLAEAQKELAAACAAVVEESKRADGLEKQKAILVKSCANLEIEKERAEQAARELREALKELFELAVVARSNGGEPYADLLASTAWLTETPEGGAASPRP